MTTTPNPITVEVTPDASGAQMLRDLADSFETHDPDADTITTLTTDQVWAIVERFLGAGLGDDPRLLGGGLDNLVYAHPDLLERTNAWLATRHYAYQFETNEDGFVFATTVNGRDPQEVRKIRWPIVGQVVEELWVESLPDTSRVRLHIVPPVGPVIEVVVYGEDAAQEVAGRFGPQDWVGVTGHFVGNVLHASVVDEVPAPS